MARSSVAVVCGVLALIASAILAYGVYKATIDDATYVVWAWIVGGISIPSLLFFGMAAIGNRGRDRWFGESVDSSGAILSALGEGCLKFVWGVFIFAFIAGGVVFAISWASSVLDTPTLVITVLLVAVLLALLFVVGLLNSIEATLRRIEQRGLG